MNNNPFDDIDEDINEFNMPKSKTMLDYEIEVKLNILSIKIGIALNPTKKDMYDKYVNVFESFANDLELVNKHAYPLEDIVKKDLQITELSKPLLDYIKNKTK